jgi:hypothetical protein
MTQNQHFLETERHRRRTLDDSENGLLDDCMAAYPTRSHHDFFTRFFNHFFGNLGKQQQCLSILLPLRSERPLPERGGVGSKIFSETGASGIRQTTTRLQARLR